MQRCRICQHDKALDEFESVRGKSRRHECKHCRREERRQRASAVQSDTASLVSGGTVPVDDVSDGRYLEEQLRQLTVDIRSEHEGEYEEGCTAPSPVGDGHSKSVRVFEDRPALAHCADCGLVDMHLRHLAMA
jgi:hypothetical protein